MISWTWIVVDVYQLMTSYMSNMENMSSCSFIEYPEMIASIFTAVLHKARAYC